MAITLRGRPHEIRGWDFIDSMTHVVPYGIQ